VFGVCHKEDPHPPVKRADSRSFKLPYPDAVAEALQVRANVVSGNPHDPRYVFSDDPTRSNFHDQARKLRPQISAVGFPFLFSSHAEGLTGKSSVNNINCFRACSM
jgi:hypothetical protein